jgi:hypothetical protein
MYIPVTIQYTVLSISHDLVFGSDVAQPKPNSGATMNCKMLPPCTWEINRAHNRGNSELQNVATLNREINTANQRI